MDASVILMGVDVRCNEVRVGINECATVAFVSLNMHCCNCFRVHTPELETLLCGRDDCCVCTNSKLPSVI